MNYIETGFAQIDKTLIGLQRGRVYYISALHDNTARGFAASLCAWVNTSGAHSAIFITDDPIPYCACEHLHFCGIEEQIDFLRLSLEADSELELPKTNLFIFDSYDLLFYNTVREYPTNKDLLGHLYEIQLYTVKRLAEEYNVAIILIDKMLPTDEHSDEYQCDFPEARFLHAAGSFAMTEPKNGILHVQYTDHRSFEKHIFTIGHVVKEIMQSYPFFQNFQ